jgi:HlyD family secretion protein
MTIDRIRRAALILLFPLLIVLSIVYLASVSKETEEDLLASGTVEALEVVVSPEVAGRIEDVLVAEGDHVEAGDLLVRLDDELLQAQRDRAEAAVHTAEAAVNSAQIKVELLKLQVELTRRTERQTDLPNRVDRWQESMPTAFDLPIWYFDQAGEIEAAEKEVDLALDALQKTQDAFEALLGESAMDEFNQAADRLAKARIRFTIADQVLERARRARDDAELEQYAEDLYDAAEATAF